MISNAVKERLLKKNWSVTCQNKQESDLVLQACDYAGITWAEREKATEWRPFEAYPVDIGFFDLYKGITCNYDNVYEKYGMENITDWFFNAIKNNDDNGKLTPQNAEEEHYVQILLAKMRWIPVEHYAECFNEWWNADNTTINITKKYRIKPEPAPTPLPISRELWSYIDKKWKYAAMGDCGVIFFYERKPTKGGSGWDSYFNVSDCPLNINADGINWETSLTERPEDV